MKDWKYILYLVLVIGLYVAVKLASPKEYNWSVSLSHELRDPYGTFALDQLLPALFPDQHIKNSYKTFYEIKDSLTSQENILVIATRFDASKEDVEVLLKHAERGGTIFISANTFSGALADTLGLTASDNFFSQNNVFNRRETGSIHFVNPLLDTTTLFYYSRENVHHYFSQLDSVRAYVIARNDLNQPVGILIPRGEGKIILNCTPLTFANIYMLQGTNSEFAANLFSYLPDRDLHRTEFYHLGRMEARTPLRFILTNEPLSWAYYILLVTILLFIVFEAKRKQRIIPVIKPLSNTTLEFVTTLGNLYYQSGDHKNIAEKKIEYFFDQVRNHFYLNTSVRDDHFVTSLSGKSGQPVQRVRSLLDLIDRLLVSAAVSREELLTLNDQLEDFWKLK